MSEQTKIQWTNHTFNPWIGCQKVHAGCTHCYAESFAKRYGKAQWGPNGTRVKTSATYWRQPLKWNRQAECIRTFDCANGDHADCCPQKNRPRVFCASLADVFEDWQGPIRGSGLHDEELAIDDDRTRLLTMNDVRRELFQLIDSTPHLDWLMLTKRPENVRRMWPLPTWVDVFPEVRRHAENHKSKATVYRKNVWIGTSISDQETYDTYAHRLYHGCRDLVPVLFLSMEPLLAPVKLWHGYDGEKTRNWGGCFDWIIVGGESGQKSRPCEVDWVRAIVQQCRAAAIPVFVKQLGAHVVDRRAVGIHSQIADDECWPSGESTTVDCFGRVRLSDSKGGDPSEWPEDLRVRQWPEPSKPAEISS